MDKIIEALVDIEKKVNQAQEKIKRDKDNLPLRIKAETEHVTGIIEREALQIIQAMKAETERMAHERVLHIEAESALALKETETGFRQRFDVLRKEYFNAITGQL